MFLGGINLKIGRTSKKKLLFRQIDRELEEEGDVRMEDLVAVNKNMAFRVSRLLDESTSEELEFNDYIEGQDSENGGGEKMLRCKMWCMLFCLLKIYNLL